MIGKALLDLGARVNLLSYSVYKQLGVREMKPTQIRLSLTDRFIKYPQGIVEVILIKIDKFIFPVDFTILDTEPVLNPNKPCPCDPRMAILSNYFLVILGQPFLVTANAVIHCQNELMKNFLAI